MSYGRANEAERLREAMLDLCSERGYEKLELTVLLERAGVGEEAFYRRYADLDACFASVLREIYSEFFARAQEAVVGETGWRDRM